jgi:hypothetical protein
MGWDEDDSHAHEYEGQVVLAGNGSGHGWMDTGHGILGRKGNQSIQHLFGLILYLLFVIIFFVDNSGMRKSFYSCNRKLPFTTSRTHKDHMK